MKNEKLHQARIDRRWSAKEAAQRIGVSYATYARWEQGTQTPYDTSLMDACKVFDLPPESLGFGQEACPTTATGTQVQPIEAETLEGERDTLVIQEHPPTETSSTHTGPFVTNGILSLSSDLSTKLAPLPGCFQPRAQELLLPAGSLADSILLFPASVIQPEKSFETAPLDCAAQCGIALAQMVALIQQWYGMAMFSHDLQNQLDREMKKLDELKSHYPLEAYPFSRRSMLFALAALPITFLTSRKQAHRLALELEEFLPQCIASVTACWHLSKGSHLETIPPIIDSYLPTLVAVLKHAPLHREMTADLIAQCYLLKSILAWHLENLATAETYCIQATHYSVIAKNCDLRLTALNQHALIFYYAKQFQRALATSEEAYATLQQALTDEHIFSIMQGRVYMYQAAFQAQQAKGEAEHTLELAQNAFALQATAVEPIPPYVDCGEASLTLWDGLTHYHLSRHDGTHARRALTSLKVFGQLQPSTDTPERFRLECLSNRILAAIRANEMEEAIDCFTAGKQGAQLLESKQRNGEIDEAYQELTERWPGEERVQKLSGFFKRPF
jgi:transcriptional regulator with XRE-family HTH domain